MKPTLPLLALSLALACAAAQATTTLSSTTAAGAGTVDSGGAFVDVLVLDCGATPACVSTSFTGAAVNLSSSFGTSFSALGLAETPGATLMRASVSLSLVDGPAPAPNDRLWFINASSGVETSLTLAPPTPADAGTLVSFQPPVCWRWPDGGRAVAPSRAVGAERSGMKLAARARAARSAAAGSLSPASPRSAAARRRRPPPTAAPPVAEHRPI